MSFPRHPGEVSAVFRPADDAPPLRLSRASVQFTATGAMTRGEFGLFRYEMPPGPGGPSPHVHLTFSESFYVLDGTVALYDGRAWVDATVGDFIYVPRGGIHAFRNASDDAPASMLILFAPGEPRERYFTELAEIAAAGRVLTPEEWTELWARNDQYAVEDETG